MLTSVNHWVKSGRNSVKDNNLYYNFVLYSLTTILLNRFVFLFKLTIVNFILTTSPSYFRGYLKIPNIYLRQSANIAGILTTYSRTIDSCAIRTYAADLCASSSWLCACVQLRLVLCARSSSVVHRTPATHAQSRKYREPRLLHVDGFVVT